MRRIAFVLLVTALIPATFQLAAQKPVYMQDGGAHQTLESIFIPPMANSPFTLTLQTEWARPLPEGGTITLVNQRKIARESSGRFYQERWLLVPKGGTTKSQMNMIQIADPNAHTLLACNMFSRSCTLSNYGGSTAMNFQPAAEPSGPLPNGSGFVRREDLGSNTIGGIDATGTREIRTINPNVMGNDRPLTITREFWFSPKLGLNLVSDISNPLFGTQHFKATDVILSEPDLQLFAVPEGFTVTDLREKQIAN